VGPRRCRRARRRRLCGRLCGRRGGRARVVLAIVVAAPPALEVHAVGEATFAVLPRLALVVPRIKRGGLALECARRARSIRRFAAEAALMILVVGEASKAADSLLHADRVPCKGRRGQGLELAELRWDWVRGDRDRGRRGARFGRRGAS